MKITTERLLLRPWKDSDAANLYQYAKDPQVGPRAGWPPHTSQAQSLAIIQTVLRDPYSFAVCLKENGEMIGAIGFHDSHSPHIHPENHEKELGYWLGVPFWGQGLMPGAIEAMLAFGFEELLLNAICVATMKEMNNPNAHKKNVALPTTIHSKMSMCLY
ncbi:GNAT family N-acetyltransferase [Enterococcus cecorum]|uniref:GNAT family N-acetyltransferase n=1 Tax=Enterococcus cecorum TaxID=44008 RepID=UPI000DFD6DB4|nr:GNAT family N-acetyltransferase [Enterococcus cecorum]RBR39284.1 hypothetical protein EB31_00170 [Enterococcus cecorum]